MRDVNDTGFELVLGRADWQRRFDVPVHEPGEEPPGASVVYRRDRRSAELRPRLERLVRSRPGAAGLTADARTSAARDRYGSWYWISASDRTAIRVRSAGDDAVTTFWPVSHRATGAGGGEGEPEGEAPAGTTGTPGSHPGGRPAEPESLFRPERRERHPPTEWSALAVLASHRLVAVAADPPHLLVFDLHGGGAPRRVPLPPVDRFVPRDASARPGGGFYLLDAPTPGEARVWAFDRTVSVTGPPGAEGEAPIFGPAGGPAAPEEREGSAREGSDRPFLCTDLPAGCEARSLIALPDDTVGLLCTSEGPDPASWIVRYDPFPSGAPVSPAIERGRVDLKSEIRPPSGGARAVEDPGTGGGDAGTGEGDSGTGDGDPGPGEEGSGWDRWRAHEAAFVPAEPEVTQSFRGTLFVVGEDGDQAYAIRLEDAVREPDEDTDEEADLDVSAGEPGRSGAASTLSAGLLPEEYPMRGYTGKALVAAGGKVYYDRGTTWASLTARPRRRYVREGRIRSSTFDSEIAGCTWHRLFVDGCIPPDAELRVESRAADDPSLIEETPWRPEPELYRRDAGAELPYYRPFGERGSDRAGAGTWELLFQDAEGRYLQIRLTLRGSGTVSPRIYAVRAYAPRFSYLDEYFPAVYRREEASADFFERYLANVEGLFTGLEGKIAQVQDLFDTRTVPEEYLDWLAGWFGATLDSAYDERRKRLFLDHAVELFEQRGTLEGMARMLELVLDPCADESLFEADGVAPAVGRAGDADFPARARFGVRVIEGFASRASPSTALGDATVPEGPVARSPADTWTVEEGAERLHDRFRRFLDEERYESIRAREETWGEHVAFPPLLPSASGSRGPRKRTDWREFVRRRVDGPYAEIDVDGLTRESGSGADAATQRFRAFLRRRFGRAERLEGVFSPDPVSFEAAQLPQSLPTGDQLQDWMQFVGFVLPTHRAAHRFRVLVPVEPGQSRERQRRRLDLAERVARREKPAHTNVEVDPYWAAFRVGTGRTGLDTILGSGSRYADLVVGRDALGDHTLAGAHPEDVVDRRVLGRDAPDAPTPL